jgi:hypothetical protein
MYASNDVLAARINEAREGDDLKALNQLTRMHVFSTRAATDLAGKLRTTPRSKTSVEQAANLKVASPPTARPWK